MGQPLSLALTNCVKKLVLSLPLTSQWSQHNFGASCLDTNYFSNILNLSKRMIHLIEHPLKFGIIKFEPICKIQWIFMDSLTGNNHFFKISKFQFLVSKMQRNASFKNILLLIVVSKKERKSLCTELTLVSTALPRLLLSKTAAYSRKCCRVNLSYYY